MSRTRDDAGRSTVPNTLSSSSPPSNTPSSNRRPARRGTGAGQGLRRAGAVLKFIAVKTFVEPIAEGRLRDDHRPPWPAGLRPIVVTGIILYALLTVMAVFAKPLRDMVLIVVPGGMSLPRLLMPVLMMAICFILAVAYTGILHLVWWVRWPGFLAICFAAVGHLNAAQTPGIPVQLLALVALIVFTAVRGRKSFASWEFLVALVLLGHIFVAGFWQHSTLAMLGDLNSLARLQTTILLLTVYAAPALMLTGAAMLELTVTVSTWTARGVWEGVMASRHRRVVGAVLMVVLLVLTWVVEAGRLMRGDPGYAPGEVLGGVLFLAVALALGALVLRAAPRSDRPGVPVDGDDIATAWNTGSITLAVALALVLFGDLLLNSVLRLFGLGSPPQLASVLVVFGGAMLIWLGVLRARANQVARALLLTMLGMGLLLGKLTLLLSLGVSIDSTWFAAVVLATAVLIWLVVRQRLTPDRGLALATVFVVSRAYDVREWLDNPFTQLSALSGTSMALLVGLLWRQLTEYQFTRAGTPRFPQSSRVLVAVANMTLVGMAITAGALALGQGVLGIDQMESAGTSELGGALLTAVLVASLLIAWLGREGGDAAPGDEFQVLPMTLIEQKDWEPGFFDQHAPRGW